MAAMDPTHIIVAVSFLLLTIGLVVKWLRQTEPADALMVRRQQDRLDNARDGLDAYRADYDEAIARLDLCEMALTYYADDRRWDGQRFVTCQAPWAIAQAAMEDDATGDALVRASADAPAADTEPNHEPEQDTYVDNLEKAVAHYADETHWDGQRFVGTGDELPSISQAPWLVAQAAHDDQAEVLAALLEPEQEERETVAPTG